MKLKLKVKPNSGKSKLEKKGEIYTAHLKSPAKNNKANRELIKLLAKRFKTSSKNIKIKNPTSKKKIIEIKTK